MVVVDQGLIGNGLGAMGELCVNDWSGSLPSLDQLTEC
jgi:hypothetical protein